MSVLAGNADPVVENPSQAKATLANGFTYTPTAIPAPATLTATGTSATSVSLSWTAVPGADHYELERREAGGSFVSAGTSASTSATDSGRTADRAYLYRVRAVSAFGELSPYTMDLATTTMFSDDPIVSGTTPIKTAHVNQLRTAVNAPRALASLDPTSFTDTPLSGIVKALHFTQIRNAIEEARDPLGLPPGNYPSTAASSQPILGEHVTSLRGAVK